MKEPIILIGGGGHCKSCIDVIEQDDKYRIKGILDIPNLVGRKILGYDIIGSDDDIPKLIKTTKNYLITLGQIESTAKRMRLFKMVKNLGGRLPCIVSPFAYKARSSQIGEGSIVMHNALINADAIIGLNCIINSNALIEHEAVVGDFCHISTGAIVNGNTRVGNRCFIGSNTVLFNNINICDEAIISAGLRVKIDITSPGIYRE
jgi:sugar O-acyltransferase (sialic acid O-acetyltransferase NeuD family)